MTTRRAGLSLFALGLGLAWTARAQARPSTRMQAEVEHLLGAIETSGCSFYRNGSWHDAKAAQAHLRSKYDYLVALGRVTSAEQFIDKAATQSSFSGQAYRVRCSDGKEIPSHDWMQARLTQFRAAP